MIIAVGYSRFSSRNAPRMTVDDIAYFCFWVFTLRVSAIWLDGSCFEQQQTCDISTRCRAIPVPHFSAPANLAIILGGLQTSDKIAWSAVNGCGQWRDAGAETKTAPAMSETKWWQLPDTVQNIQNLLQLLVIRVQEKLCIGGVATLCDAFTPCYYVGWYFTNFLTASVHVPCCAVLKTVQRPGVCSAVYGTSHYIKEPLKLFDKSI